MRRLALRLHARSRYRPCAARDPPRASRRAARWRFATWAPAKRNPWATAYGPVLIERGLQEPPKPGEPVSSLSESRSEIEPLVRAAGFDEVVVEEVPVEYRFRDWEEYVRVMTSLAASLRAVLGTLDEATRADVDAGARVRLERFRGDKGYVLPGVALVDAR